MISSEIRLVHVITTIERGGAENAVLALAQEQVRNGYKVVVVPLKGSLELTKEFLFAGVSIDTSLIEQSFLKQVFLFRKQYKGNAIFHAHLPRSELLLSLCKSQNRFFVTRHNAEQFYPSAPKIVSSFLSRYVTYRSESVIAISYAVLHFLLKNREISKKSQYSVIYYGYMRRNNNHLQQTYSFNKANRTLRIGTVSRLAPQKNLNLLIQLAILLKAKHHKFLIQIVGAGPDKLLLENKVKEFGLEKEIQFLGRKSDVMPFLKEQDVFVLTSNYEGFGLVLLEAMDAFLPIIAPRNSAIPEVLGKHHPGLFKSSDVNSLSKTLFYALQTPKTYEEILKIQSRQLDLFSLEKYFNSHHELYANASMGK